jgi:hypothetical protein
MAFFPHNGKSASNTHNLQPTMLCLDPGEGGGKSLHVRVPMRPAVATITLLKTKPIQIGASCSYGHNHDRHDITVTKKHFGAISDELCFVVCDLIGVPQVNVYRITPKIIVHFIMQPPVHHHLDIPEKSTLFTFLKFPRQYEVFSPFFSTHSRSLSGMLLMRPFTMCGWGFSHTSSNVS